MIGLTDGIEVDDGLASPGPGASRRGGRARQSTFNLGDQVKHNTYRHFLVGQIVGFTAKKVRVAFTNVWGTDSEALYSAKNLAHVEPTASVEASISGEANIYSIQKGAGPNGEDVAL